MESSNTSSPSSVNTPTSSHRTSNSNSSSSQANINGMVRYAQLKDMSIHQNCTERNKKSLMTEQMKQLNVLVKVLGETDWMFAKKDDDCRPTGFNKGVEERW